MNKITYGMNSELIDSDSLIDHYSHLDFSTGPGALVVASMDLESDQLSMLGHERSNQGYLLQSASGETVMEQSAVHEQPFD